MLQQPIMMQAMFLKTLRIAYCNYQEKLNLKSYLLSVKNIAKPSVNQGSKSGILFHIRNDNFSFFLHNRI